MPGREIIQIHIGQAGVQIANACWELYCLEHAIKTDGTLYDRNSSDDGYSPFFSLTAFGQAVPRVVMIDLEPSVVDEIRTGYYRNLFNPSLLLTGKEDASNNFARGRYSIGLEMLDLALDRTRKMAEECGNLQGFIVFRGFGGGTGGGFGSLFVQALNQEFSKCSLMEVAVFPSPKLSSIIVEPYNTVLSTHASMENHDLCFIMENEAVYDVLCSKLNIIRPNYTDVNRVLGQVISNITASLRYEGALNVDLREFQTNLVPYRRIHFPLVSYAPFVPVSRPFNEMLSIASLTNACFEANSHMMKCDSKCGKYLSCCLLYRGDVTPTDVNNAIVSLKNKKVVKFVDWSPVGFKVGINYMPPVEVPGGVMARITRAVSLLANNTAIRYTWERLLKKFSMMLTKEAFVHHYVAEGMEESEFVDAKEDLKALIMDYKEVDF